MRGHRFLTAWFVVIFFTATIGTLPAATFDPPERPGKADYDVRLPVGDEDRDDWVLRSPTAAQQAAARALAFELPGTMLEWDGMSGAPAWLSAPAGQRLSEAAAGTPEDVAREFLRQRAVLFGLSPSETERLRLSSVVPVRTGSRHVHFVQTHLGVDVFGSHVNVNLDPDGAVRSLGSLLYAGVTTRLATAIGPAEAVRLALLDVYPEVLFTGEIVSVEEQADRLTRFTRGELGLQPTARLVVFPEADDARMAWEVLVAERSLETSYRILVDALDGNLLFRHNMTLYAEARYLDANRPAPQTEEFAPDQHVLATIPSSTAESPNGWIDGAGTTLEGNNAVSHVGYWTQPSPTDPGGIYDYPYNTASAAAVNAWWWTNEAHDWFYGLGFDEPGGNFQQDNFGAGGSAGDPMQVTAFVNGKRNNAFYRGGTDGNTSTINFYWATCRFCGDHDGFTFGGNRTPGERHNAFMGDLILHEYAHGVTQRMVGGPDVGGCLDPTQSAGMSESWSDVFSTSFFGDPSFWEHSQEGIGFERDVRHDLTYGDLCNVTQGCQSHADGMIWSGALWDLRESMRALQPADGLDQFHELIVHSLASTPCDPAMTGARNAILDADTDLYGSAHHGVIWNVFASRGLGQNASTNGAFDDTPTENFTVPAAHVCTPPATPTGLTATPDGSNAIRLDYDATGASAVGVWREDLDNPFDRPVRIGFSGSTTTFTDAGVQGGKSYRYHLYALGGGGLPCSSAASGTADATATGSCTAWPVFEGNVSATEDDGSCGVTIQWDPAIAGCTGQPVVYNVYRAPTPGFEPSERLLLGRTTSTSFLDVPPDALEEPFYLQFGRTYFYLVLAQHGTLDDPADHRGRGPDQLLRWEPGLPTGPRTTVQSWDFDDGAQGWTANNANDPTGGWVVVDPSPTYYGIGHRASVQGADLLGDQGTLLAPDEAAGGTGMAWVTGDAGGPSSVADHDCDFQTYLNSPTWDATGGATIVSFDHWTHVRGNFWNGMEIRIDNGVDPVKRIGIAGLRTVPTSPTAGRHGWQRFELDTADFVPSTATMSIQFATFCGWAVSEFGIDNVLVESATKCSRTGLTLQNVTVDDSPAGWGNGNGVLEPGETARLTVELSNDGSATAVSPAGTLSSPMPGVLVHESTASFPDIPAAGSGSSLGDSFTVTAAAGLGCEDSMVFDFRFTDASGVISQAVWEPELGNVVVETVFEDDFETDKGWLAGGSIGGGQWQRGDPVGTLDGGNLANPEDCADGPGTECYVTENGLPGGGKDLTDVDGQGPVLRSPLIDFSAYKRARMTFDLWFYDNSSNSDEDYAEYGAIVDDGTVNDLGSATRSNPTSGWLSRTIGLHNTVPMVEDVRLRFRPWDRGALLCSGCGPNTVEMGVDNVFVDADRIVCDPLGVDNPPNGIGDTLRLDKVGGELEVFWTASPIDGTHDGAAYYELYVSTAPDAGFGVADTAAATSLRRPLDPVTEYYKLSAVNAAGTSGDEPAP